MAGIRKVLAAKTEGEVPDAGSVANVRPDALILHGAEGLAALDEATPPFAFDAARVFVVGAACGGVGAGRIAEYAARYGVTVIAAGEGCGAAALSALGALRPGDLVLAAGTDVGDAGDVLHWPLALDEVPAFLATGRLSLRVPAVYRVECAGELRPGTAPADVGLYIAGQFGARGAAGAALEFGGSLTVNWKAAACSGALSAARACDPLTTFLAAGCDGADASFAYDFTTLEPQVGVFRGDDVRITPLKDAAGTAVRLVLVGPASAADLAAAAALLRDAKIASRVTLFVAAATRRDFLSSVASGDLPALATAGAAVLSPCAARWLLSFESNDTVVTTALCPSRAAAARGMTAYHVNPAAAAAAALAGEVCDPKPLC